MLDTKLDASKKVAYNAGEYLVNKIAEAVTKSNDDSTRNLWRNNYSTKERGEILNKLCY